MLKVPIEGIPGFREPVSSWSHFIGAVIFLILSPFLVRKGRCSIGRMISLGIFAFSAVFQLSMSGVYHMLSYNDPGRPVLERLDHAAIFVLIAGTFTPLYVILFRGVERWGTMLFMWSAAITGVTLKSVFFRDVPEVLGLVLYLGFGWVGLVGIVRLGYRYGPRFIWPIMAGGLSYTVAAVMDYTRWPILIHNILGPHELFHIGVLFGLGFHWFFIHRVADREPEETGCVPLM